MLSWCSCGGGGVCAWFYMAIDMEYGGTDGQSTRVRIGHAMLKQ